MKHIPHKYTFGNTGMKLAREMRFNIVVILILLLLLLLVLLLLILFWFSFFFSLSFYAHFHLLTRFVLLKAYTHTHTRAHNQIKLSTSCCLVCLYQLLLIFSMDQFIEIEMPHRNAPCVHTNPN